MRNVRSAPRFLCDGALIAAEHLPLTEKRRARVSPVTPGAPAAPVDFNLESAERGLILRP
jgi:hypothetical protein